MNAALPLLSPEDLARMFGDDVTERKVLDWMRLYDWPHVKVGRLVRFTDAQVTEILRRHTVTSKPDLPATRVTGQTKRSAARSS